MSKFIVTIPILCWVGIEVLADSTEEAESKALEELHVIGYGGNGGTDKLIGVSGEHMSIECDSYVPCEYNIHFEKL